MNGGRSLAALCAVLIAGAAGVSARQPAFAPRAAAGRQATFTARVDAVRIDVLVTDNGRPVLGLTPADFEVIDNGVPQRVDLVLYEQIPLNVVLAFDMSESVAGERLEHLRAAGASLLGGLRRDDRAALVTFNTLVVRDAALTGDVAKVRAALDATVGTSRTALVEGVFAGLMTGESDAGRALLIVFSDGLDTASFLPADTVLEIAKRSDVVAYIVSTGRTKQDFLRDLASFTGGRLYETEKTTNLGAVFLSVLEEFRQRYLVSYTPQGVAKDGWHKLDVRVKKGRPTVKARPGYLAGGS